MRLDDLLDVNELNRLIDEHYVTSRAHPVLALNILNYTPKTQFDRYWTNETELCRGLIFHVPTGQIVSRPFRKFFNLGERQTEIPDEPFEAFQKLDGCLGITYLDADGVPSIATRGSFMSEQAEQATRVLRSRYQASLPALTDVCQTVTLCVECILPEYRIVVDYGGREDLVLLAAFETATGRELAADEIDALGLPFERAKRWSVDSLASASELVEGPLFDGEEGVVVRFASGSRLKIKREEYQRLHRIVTRVTPRRIWEMLMHGSPPVSRLYAGTSDVFQTWARAHVEQIEGQYQTIEREALGEHARLMAAAPLDRKTYAAGAAAHPHAPILFKLYDEKPYSDVIWKRIRPGAADPFRVEA